MVCLAQLASIFGKMVAFQRGNRFRVFLFQESEESAHAVTNHPDLLRMKLIAATKLADPVYDIFSNRGVHENSSEASKDESHRGEEFIFGKILG